MARKKENVHVVMKEQLGINISDKYRVKINFTANICNKEFDCKKGDVISLSSFEHGILSRFLE